MHITVYLSVLCTAIAIDISTSKGMPFVESKGCVVETDRDCERPDKD